MALMMEKGVALFSSMKSYSSNRTLSCRNIWQTTTVNEVQTLSSFLSDGGEKIIQKDSRKWESS